jgi:hypothetical protein
MAGPGSAAQPIACPHPPLTPNLLRIALLLATVHIGVADGDWKGNSPKHPATSVASPDGNHSLILVWRKAQRNIVLEETATTPAGVRRMNLLLPLPPRRPPSRVAVPLEPTRASHTA